MPRMLDLFCGRFGWSRAFAARGWECVGIDLVEPAEIPDGCVFIRRNVLEIDVDFVRTFDFVCASSPCEEFSVHTMKHFHPNPPFPDMGIALFCYTRRMLERSGVRFVMENVRGAERFVGQAAHRCGPFYLWGNAVPPLMAKGITKGVNHASKVEKWMTPEQKRELRRGTHVMTSYGSKDRKELTASWATIPPELSTAVADFAERLMEVTV